MHNPEDDDENYDPEFMEYCRLDQYQDMIGKKYTFEDSDSLEIIQIKLRNDGPWVTYHVQQGPGIPRKLQLRMDEFQETYGHLFGLSEDD